MLGVPTDVKRMDGSHGQDTVQFNAHRYQYVFFCNVWNHLGFRIISRIVGPQILKEQNLSKNQEYGKHEKKTRRILSAAHFQDLWTQTLPLSHNQLEIYLAKSREKVSLPNMDGLLRSVRRESPKDEGGRWPWKPLLRWQHQPVFIFSKA